jgi:hypothetical protein
LILDNSSVSEVRDMKEDEMEMLRTRAQIRGDGHRRTGVRQASKPGAEGGSTSNPLSTNVLQGTMEHLIREVLAEKSFGQLVEDMLAQDTPFVLQYEDTPAPGEPDHRQAAPAPADPCELDGGFDELKALLSHRPAPVWGSELLSDFPEPLIPDLMDEGASASLGGTTAIGVVVPAGGQQAVPPSPMAMAEPVTPSQALLDEAMYEHGEVDLEAFKNSAGEVLDEMLLGVMDDVIAGRLNWQRPLPRIRGRAR